MRANHSVDQMDCDQWLQRQQRTAEIIKTGRSSHLLPSRKLLDMFVEMRRAKYICIQCSTNTIQMQCNNSGWQFSRSLSVTRVRMNLSTKTHSLKRDGSTVPLAAITGSEQFRSSVCRLLHLQARIVRTSFTLQRDIFSNNHCPQTDKCATHINKHRNHQRLAAQSTVCMSAGNTSFFFFSLCPVGCVIVSSFHTHTTNQSFDLCHNINSNKCPKRQLISILRGGKKQSDVSPALSLRYAKTTNK